MNGKYGRPSEPTFERTMSATNSYIISAADCKRPGTTAAGRIAIAKNRVLTITAKTIKRAELVNETSNPKRLSS